MQMPERQLLHARRLTGQQVGKISRKLSDIGEAVPSFIGSLQGHGCAAFLPYYEFVESFCTEQADLELHRQCIIEGAKNRLGRPLSMALTAEYRDYLFFSPYVRQLLDERDRANGVPEAQLGTRYPGEIWRREVDPCERHLTYRRVRDKEAFEEKWAAMLEAQRRQLNLEVDRHATGISTAYGFDQQGRLAFYKAVMERDALPLGFRHHQSRSLATFPVFAKEITDGWELCWSVEDARMFSWNTTEGRFNPCLLICRKGLSGNLARAAVGEFMPIDYRFIVPGFGNAYWVFLDLNDLEVVIRAHLRLYEIMAPMLEEAVIEGLG